MVSTRAASQVSARVLLKAWKSVILSFIRRKSRRLWRLLIDETLLSLDVWHVVCDGLPGHSHRRMLCAFRLCAGATYIRLVSWARAHGLRLAFHEACAHSLAQNGSRAGSAC